MEYFGTQVTIEAYTMQGYSEGKDWEGKFYIKGKKKNCSDGVIEFGNWGLGKACIQCTVNTLTNIN